MRKLIASLYVSLDGFAADASEQMRWVTDDFGEQMTSYSLHELRGSDVLVLGRVTYEIMAAYWPSAGEQGGPFTQLMNDIPKVVFSRTLKEEDLSWKNARLAKGDLAEEIRKIKQQPGKDLSISGSVNLVQGLMKLGLLDELRLQVHPIVFGSDGRKPVFEGVEKTNLHLLQASVLDSRVVALEYRLTGVDS
jgi:dihydrofolate reductase